MARKVLYLLILACSCGPSRADLDAKFAEANKLFGDQSGPKALKLYQEIVDADSKYISARIMMARIYYYERKFADAESTLKKAVDAQPENIDALFWLARVQSVVPDKKEEAMKNLELLLQRDGSRVDALVLKGMLHEEKKEISQAIVAYRAATQSESDIGQAHLRLANIYGAAGMEDMKRNALVRAALLAPGLIAQKKER